MTPYIYYKQVSDRIANFIIEYDDLAEELRQKRLAELEPALAKVFFFINSDYEEKVKDGIIIGVERQVVEHYLSQSLFGDIFSVRHDVLLPKTSIPATPNINGIASPGKELSYDELKSNLIEKYSYSNLSGLDKVNPRILDGWRDIKYVYYEKTRQDLNGGHPGRLNQIFYTNLSTIFWKLVELDAIDMSDENYGLLLLRFGGVNICQPRYDEFIHWKLETRDLSCFIKYIVRDGSKYEKAARFFKIGNDEYKIDKQSSIYADKSIILDPIRKLQESVCPVRIEKD